MEQTSYRRERYNLRSHLIGEHLPCHVLVGDTLLRKGTKLSPRKIHMIADYGIENCKWQSRLVKQAFIRIANKEATV